VLAIAADNTAAPTMRLNPVMDTIAPPSLVILFAGSATLPEAFAVAAKADLAKFYHAFDRTAAARVSRDFRAHSA